MISILQINVGVCRAAQDLALATAAEMGVDILILSEPYRCRTEDEGWFSDVGAKAAVVVFNPEIQIRDIGPMNNAGFRWVKVGDITLYACYWSPNTAYTLFLDFLDRLEGSIRRQEGTVIAAGDFNAKSPAWGDHSEEPKGRALVDMTASLGLSVCNMGDKPTFSRAHAGGVSRSHIDITFVTERCSHLVRDWKTLDQYSASLHRYITFKVSGTAQRDRVSAEERWSWRKYDRTRLLNYIESAGTLSGDDALSVGTLLDQFFKDACNSCMPKGTYKGGKKPAYWWTQEISDMREACKRTRRKYKRGRHRPTDEHRKLKEDFAAARKQLKVAIRRSKRASWIKLCEEVDTDPWGLPYKLVTKRLQGGRPIPGLSTPGRVESIVDALFPKEAVTIWPPKAENYAFPKVTCAEILDLCAKIPRGKAPGPDGVPDLVVKEVAMGRPDIIRDVFNVCLEEGVFPLSWKVARLVLLRKGDKPLDNPSSYRPICLLSTVGKLFERLVKKRLENELEDIGNLNDRQYGFRKGRSTVDAMKRVMDTVDAAGSGPLYRRKLCAVVALDVANAFNSAKWPKIVEALRAKGFSPYLVGMVQSYLSDRRVVYEGSSRVSTCGVPQGSVLGPLLWNLMYDELLQVDTGGNVDGRSTAELVAFADDVAVVATGHTSHMLESVTNNALEKISDWMTNAGLELSIGKTEAVILTKKRGYTLPELAIKGTRIEVKDKLKYLGLELHRVLGFKNHLETAAARAQTMSLALSRLMPNVGGSGQRKRKLLSTAVMSKLLYASPVWVNALVFARNVDILCRPQRTIAIKTVMAYRTISTAAVLVIAAKVPAHLQARERAEKYARKHEQHKERVVKEIRSETMRRWQAEWDDGTEGRWTRRLIQDVAAWTNRRHGTVDFHMTQVLSGHGCFGFYLHRFKKLEQPLCVDCQDPRDDAEHAIFDCDRWWSPRRALEVAIGRQFKPETFVNAMLESRENWAVVKEFINRIMATREEEERERQRRQVVIETFNI